MRGIFTKEKNISNKIMQTISVDGELEVRPYYAGHVLGAAMFLVRSRGESVVYTGDYNIQWIITAILSLKFRIYDTRPPFRCCMD